MYISRSDQLFFCDCLHSQFIVAWIAYSDLKKPQGIDMKRSAALLCGLALACATGMASASDQVFIDKKGNLIVKLANHSTHRVFSLSNTGRRNQIAYDIQTGSAEPVWGVLNNFTRNVVIRANNGDDTVVFYDLNLPGNVVVTTGRGDDNIVLNNTTIAGKLTANTGGHDDFVEFNNSTVFRDTVVRTGGGHDDVILNGSSFEGKVRVLLGGGWDELALSGNSFTTYSPLFNGQGQRDSYKDDGTNSFHGGDPRIRKFESKHIDVPTPPVVDPPAVVVDPPAPPVVVDPPAPECSSILTDANLTDEISAILGSAASPDLLDVDDFALSCQVFGTNGGMVGVSVSANEIQAGLQGFFFQDENGITIEVPLGFPELNACAVQIGLCPNFIATSLPQ